MLKPMACELVDWSEDWTPPGSFALCESGAAATNVFCAKAERQLQSALPERKSTPRLRITSLPIVLLIVTFYL
ncbi:hypothetical protein [Lysinibacillus sp. G4S2]|uniref:hypothetical protein n=1 Tax=Lysinibacillus sp. G4S2 TaxID=3055859 RepID=UPI0025A0DE4A|nr:hypothetical protein [Lysinibacillus sp. G4S2]MDM5250588.1 hypothetical protein [Lysinibacillus sp. G4S2]